MSSGILPNIIKGVGGFVSDVVGGIGSGKPFLETLGSAAKRGLTTALGGTNEGESAGPIRAVPVRGRSAANARPVVVPASAGVSRVVRVRGPMHRSADAEGMPRTRRELEEMMRQPPRTRRELEQRMRLYDEGPPRAKRAEPRFRDYYSD